MEKPPPRWIIVIESKAKRAGIWADFKFPPLAVGLPELRFEVHHTEDRPTVRSVHVRVLTLPNGEQETETRKWISLRNTALARDAYVTAPPFSDGVVVIARINGESIRDTRATIDALRSNPVAIEVIRNG
jgi:hypothetical protein